MNETERNVAIMRAWYQKVWNERNQDFIDQHYATDGKAYGLGGRYVEGPTAFKAFHSALLGKFPDMQVELLQCFGDGELVAVNFRAAMPHGGRTLELRGGGICRFVDGKIVEAWNLVDFLELFEQMGIVQANSIETMLTA